MIEDGIYYALKNHTGVAAKTLVAGSSPARYNIFPLKLAEGTDMTGGYALSYTEINQEFPNSYIRSAMYQINAFGTSFEKARQLAKDVDDCLTDLRNVSLGGVFPVVAVTFKNRHSLFDQNAQLWYFAIEVNIVF